VVVIPTLSYIVYTKLGKKLPAFFKLIKLIFRLTHLNNYLHYNYIMDSLGKIKKLKSNLNLMSNIKTQKFQGSNFYHTICSKARWEQQGNEYESPQQKSFDNVKTGDIKLCIKNEKGSSYGSLPFEDLENIYKQNHYLYEILTDTRKFYLDIEFPYQGEDEAVKKLSLIFKLIKKCFSDCGIETSYKRSRDFFSKNIGVGEQGGFKDISKFSAHLVLNNNFYFKSVYDIHKFTRYMKQTINETDEFQDLIFETDRARDYAIDFGVYTKNRLFKLPYQSKPNSNRIQRPAPKTVDSLECCLISYKAEGTVVDVSNITLKTEEKSYSVKNKAGRVIGHNISNNVAQFLEEYKEALPLDCPIPEGSPDSGSLEYVIKSMYNGNNVEWSVFCAVGMAIKRASGGNGFDLWLDWANKSGKPQSLSDMRGLWGRFSVDKGYGFSTLLNMAKLCNPLLISQEPYKYLFDFPHFENKNVVNKRYLDVEDFNLKSDISFINSPMGTGKSFNIHKIQKHFKKIIYLSSKRAFATAMGEEFKEDGFKNYINLSISERYHCDKLIISLESFHQINPDDIDLLIVDESESIFNVIGSHTLQTKGEGLNNLLVFEKAIKNAKKVLVMDAFLSKRSFNAIQTIRPNSKSALTINEWKPEKRTATQCKNKAAMWTYLKSCLTMGRRCVVVSGSKKFAIEMVSNAITEGLLEGSLDNDGVVDSTEIKLYHSGNPLDLSTKVNEEWSKCKLLIYSPTITCGVSYDNPKAKFDDLFVYMPNKFSACFRDATQALKRVREFTQKNIYICLSTHGQYNRDMSPVYFDKVKELIYTYKPQIFTDEKHYISLQNTELKEYSPLKNWVSETRIYNILESNISGIYLEKVATKYLDIENIEITDKFQTSEILPEYEEQSFSWEDISNLNYEIEEIEEKKAKNERLTSEEYYFLIADGFKKSLKSDVSEFHKSLYWEYYIKKSQTRSQYYNTIKLNKLIQKNSIEGIFEKSDSKKILELNNFYDERFPHIYKMFKQMGIITEDNKLDLEKDFMKEDLEPLLKDYEKLRMDNGLKAFNQLLKTETIREWSKGEKVEGEEKEEVMDSDKLYIMIKHLAKDLLGLEAGRIKQKKKRVIIDGIKKQKFFGVFRFSPYRHIIKVFHPETKKEEIIVDEPLHVLNVAQEDILKPDEWFSDSGITSDADEEF
jgi:hypothetical protein